MDPKRTPWLGPLKKPKPESQAGAAWPVREGNTTRNRAPETGWTGLRGKGVGEGQGDSTGSLQSRPKKFHHQKRQGVKPRAGTPSSLDAKAKALKEEAQDRGDQVEEDAQKP